MRSRSKVLFSTHVEANSSGTNPAMPSVPSKCTKSERRLACGNVSWRQTRVPGRSFLKWSERLQSLLGILLSLCVTTRVRKRVEMSTRMFSRCKYVSTRHVAILRVKIATTASSDGAGMDKLVKYLCLDRTCSNDSADTGPILPCRIVKARKPV
eukprot:scaffold482_cov266-Amphora_coffeaeformis.AAC.67